MEPLEAALRGGAEAGEIHITVDLRRVDFLDSSGLSLLVAESRRLRSDAHPLAPRVLMTPAGQPARVLRLGGFDKILEIVCDTEADQEADQGADQPIPHKQRF